MAYTLDERLNRLKQRRSDPALLDKTSLALLEAYQKRVTNTATMYALGSMQEVNPRSTQISIEEADKVQMTLKSGLENHSLYPVFRKQGSVPLNVHIYGGSDVDLLVIEGAYLSVAPCTNSKKTYSDYTGRGTLVDDVMHLREKSVEVLKTRYWGAKVDATPAKSIELSEGAFRRKVDVVPSHWHDSADYQQSLKDVYRGVTIINRHTREKIQNFPFLYMAHIDIKNNATAGGTKMSIRLVKNVKNDTSTDINLSSYDIGSLMYHCPQEYIQYSPARDLQILTGTERWFDELSNNKLMAMSLDTPDNTRKIIDSEEKWRALGLMAKELAELSAQVAYETAPYHFNQKQIRDHLQGRMIPMVA